jgi:AcrR family transcriptional regulator
MVAHMSTDVRPGLRERKKEATRRLIADTARGLFAERGFDAVTVADVARAADVAEKTVFNYFPTKEDLFYSDMEAFEERLLAAIRERPAGDTVLEAFGRFFLAPQGVLALDDDAEATARLQTVTRVITGSPALLARERRVHARYTDALAALLAEETGVQPGAVEPWVAAHALLGVHRALIEYVRRRVVAGAKAPAIAREVQAEGTKAIALLERGLASYARRR